MRLSDFPDAANAAAVQAQDTGPLMQRIAYIVIGPVKRRARVRTGAMRNSVHDRVEPNRAVIGTNIRYAPYVNKKYPFLEPGWMEAKGQVEDELRAFGLKIISKAKGN